jgi:hypothetical protein
VNLALRLTPQVTQRQALQLELLPLTGGACDSIFPLIEAWLQESTDHWNALREISSKKTDPGFQSVIDFILVTLHPSLKRSCFAFYDKGGLPLRKLITERERCYFEGRMHVFLEIAYAAFSNKRRLSWAAASAIVDEVEAA